MKNSKTDVLIIGAGPAGMTAALQLKRSGLDPILVERDCPGGALLNADWVENYPAFPQGISGPDLVERFIQHLRQFSIPIHSFDIQELRFETDWFLASGPLGEIHCRGVIIATGCAPLRLNISGEDSANVFHELRQLPMVAPGAFIAVIGSGDVAFDYALSLAKRQVQVTILMRSAQPHCLALLETRARQNPSIRVLPQVEVVRIEELNLSLQLYFSSKAMPPLNCDLVVVAIGRKPNLGFMELFLNSPRVKTVPLFYAGDVVNGSFRQVGIAVGDGLRCAMEMVKRLNGKN